MIKAECYRYDEEFARFEDPPTVDEDFAAILGPKFCLCCHRLENQTRVSSLISWPAEVNDCYTSFATKWRSLVDECINFSFHCLKF